MRETCFNTWVRQIPWRRKWQLLAWEIPWMEEHGRLQSMGLQTDALFHYKRTCIIFKSKQNIHDCHNCLLCVCVCACTLSCLNLLWPHLAHQASLSMEIFWQYWSGLTFSSPRDLPDSGIKSTSPVVPALIGDSLTLSHQGSPDILLIVQN